MGLVFKKMLFGLFFEIVSTVFAADDGTLDRIAERGGPTRFQLSNTFTAVVAGGLLPPPELFMLPPPSLLLVDFFGDRVTEIERNTGDTSLVATIIHHRYGTGIQTKDPVKNATYQLDERVTENIVSFLPGYRPLCERVTLDMLRNPFVKNDDNWIFSFRWAMYNRHRNSNFMIALGSSQTFGRWLCVENKKKDKLAGGDTALIATILRSTKEGKGIRNEKNDPLPSDCIELILEFLEGYRRPDKRIGIPKMRDPLRDPFQDASVPKWLKLSLCTFTAIQYTPFVVNIQPIIDCCASQLVSLPFFSPKSHTDAKRLLQPSLHQEYQVRDIKWQQTLYQNERLVFLASAKAASVDEFPCFERWRIFRGLPDAGESRLKNNWLSAVLQTQANS